MIITDSASLWYFAARRSAKAMAISLSSTGTQLRDTTGTPFGLACQRPRSATHNAPIVGAPLDKEVAIAYELRLA